MQIRDWMTKNLFTVTQSTTLLKAARLMKENSIRRLPVVDNGKLIGIVTDRDVKDASPAKTTTLDVHELYYLFSEIKVKDIMTHRPIVLSGDDSLEKALVGIDGYGGGHEHACGAAIKKHDFKKFIENIEAQLTL